MSSEPSAILLRTNDVLVLAKPSGIATTSPDGKGAFTEVAARLDPRAPKLHPTSRLDAEVSGCVTFARNERAIRTLLDARSHGAYRRTYLAITTGGRSEGAASGVWNDVIALDPRDPRRRVVLTGNARGERAQHASTEWSHTATSAHGGTLLVLHPRTGRTHQLRVHAFHHGLPLLGDVHYGGSRRVTLPDGRIVTAARTMLHCLRVTVQHVQLEGGGFDVRCEPPDDFVRVWQSLGGDASAWASL